jgi:rfaE bifunctional protein kinase chain/domain
MADLKGWVPRLAGQAVLVIGDVFLDEYLIGRATRMSREAPIPVLEFEQRQLIPGGAANPAANIVALGSAALQVGVIGSDSTGAMLRQVLQGRGIDISSLVVDAGRPTTVKTRILAQMGLRFPQQVARLDTLSRQPISEMVEQQVAEAVRERLPEAQAVLFSDYHTGLLTASLVKKVRETAERAGLLLTADAQGRLDQYSGFGIVKCNADEARDFLRRDLRTDGDFAQAAAELRERLGLTLGMVITRGADGAMLARADGTTLRCPAPAVTDVYDTVGAGDTTIAVLTLAVLGGAPLDEATMLANTASGLVVRRVGNYAPRPDELARALESWGGE